MKKLCGGRAPLLALGALLASLIAGPATAAGPADDFQASVKALEWRNVGPFNGGRSTSVVGHPTDRQVFWFGHGSVDMWKTEDAGTFWMPVAHVQFRYASVGAIALYEKNPDIMYVGLGEPQMRRRFPRGGDTYTATDGGWHNLAAAGSGRGPHHLTSTHAT